MCLFNKIKAVASFGLLTFTLNYQNVYALSTKGLDSLVGGPLDYSETASKYFAAFARASFCDINNGPTFSQGIKPTNSTLFKNDDVQGLISVDSSERKIIISFRGTSEFVTWLRNAQFNDQITYEPNNCGSVPTHNCTVHPGLFGGYETIQETVHKHLQWQKDNLENFADYEVHTTGHSFGGALALLCAMDLATNYKTTVKLDIVPHMFFLGGERDYLHGGSEVFYKDGNGTSNNYNICPNADFGFEGVSIDTVPKLNLNSLFSMATQVMGISVRKGTGSYCEDDEKKC
eukprot:Pgem_evm1s19154